MKRPVGLGLSLLLPAILTACAYHGLPRNARPVGGGLNIEWQAPVAGTAILREEHTGAILTSKSLEPGQTFDFPEGIEDTETLQRLFGEEGARKGRFVLYFAPNP